MFPVNDPAGGSYEISYWTKIDLAEVGTVKSTGTIYHADGSQTEFLVNVGESPDVLGNWIRASGVIELKPGLNKISMNSDLADGYITPVKDHRIRRIFD